MLLANVAIPTFFPHWIVGFVILFPVIVIEALIAQRRLSLTFRTALRVCGRANVKSTLIGIPIAYFLSLFVTLPFALLIEHFAKPDGAWPLFLSGIFIIGGMRYSPPTNVSLLTSMVLLVPYYYASVRIEGRTLQTNLPSVDPAQIRSTAIAMNRASYALLLVVFFLLFVLTR